MSNHMFSFITLFPELIAPYFNVSVIGRAVCRGIIKTNCINVRDFSCNRHSKVDNKMISGGAGMILDPEVLHRAISHVRGARVVFLSPCGARWCQRNARRMSKLSHIAFVCGRYEGFDERSIELDADEIFSIGDFILSGGEIAAIAMADSIARNIPGVLGNSDSLLHESFEKNMLEAPNFTKSKEFELRTSLNAPLCFSSGNHARIASLKSELSKLKTRYFRVDLHQKGKYEK